MKSAIAATVFLMLFAATEAGYVDLFKDADFENKLTRVDDIVLDVCYTFKCKHSSSPMDNSITFAKWHGLPEKSQYFGENGDTTITFYVDLDCKGDYKSWLIKTQSTKKLYFPENFRLDGVNDAISSFKVINAGGVAGVLYVCAATEQATVTNNTRTDATMLITHIAIAVAFAGVVQAGYVDLYRNADFKYKLAKVDDVALDACYSFTCSNLDDAVTSAKWHDLPETGSFFNGGVAVISFYTGKNCDGKTRSWDINTQSKKNKYFPENFKLDGINDEISSFRAVNKGGDAGMMYICSLPESIDATNATLSATSGVQ